MAVDFSIRWDDGAFESWPFSGQKAAHETIVPIAEGLGLLLVPHFPAFFPVDEQNLSDVIREMTALRNEMQALGKAYVIYRENFSEIIRLLETLIGRWGWRASFG